MDGLNGRDYLVDLSQTIVQNTYVAGRFCYPYNQSADCLAGKAFHLTRAADAVTRFVEAFGNRPNARKALMRVLEDAGIGVIAYNTADQHEQGSWSPSGKPRRPKALDFLVDFLMGDICHMETTRSFMENFMVAENQHITTEKSRTEARRTLKWLADGVAAVGVDPAFVTAGV